MKITLFLISFSMLTAVVLAQQTEVTVDFARDLGPMRMEQMALGQGGLSEEPMLAGRTLEIRALHPALLIV